MLKTFDFEKTPVVEIVNDILVDASKRGASDIHFDPHEEVLKVRIRIDGELRDYCRIPDSVKKIGANAFVGTNLATVTVAQDADVDPSAFSSDVNIVRQ